MKVTTVFESNLLAYDNGFRYIINQGSARSSKTFSLLQLLYLIAKYSDIPLVISVVSCTLPHLKRGAIRDFLNIMIGNNLYVDADWSKGNLIYKVNKSTIEFFSVDSPSRIYGAARDILFVNEVNTIPEETFRQLIIRTRGTVFCDFNPTHEFYIHTDYMFRENAKYIHSTFKQNQHLHPEIIKELIEAGKRNENFRRVFVDGEIGKIEGAVFNNWEIGEFDESLQSCYGQDYGFSNDPSTLIKVAVDKKKKIVYLDECFYLPGLSTNQLYTLNEQYAKNSKIIADSAEGRLITELLDKGNNIEKCDKGPGSVGAGLLAMQDYLFIISERSINLHKEFKNYVWLDNKSKLVIDAYNHGIDAARYAFRYLTKEHFVRKMKLR